MDFDLFELDEDDDLLSSINLEPTQMPNEDFTVDTVPEFQCQGEDSTSAQFSLSGFIKNGFMHHTFTNIKNKSIDEISLTVYGFEKEHLNAGVVNNYVFGQACMNIQYLLSNIRGPLGTCNEETSVYDRRQHVTLLLHLILQTTHNEQYPLIKPQLSRLRALLNNCIQMDTWKIIYFANSFKGNQCNIPTYHLLHGVLEWKFLDLCILYKYECMNPQDNAFENPTKSSDSCVTSQFERIIDDLLICSIFVYSKKNSAELLHSSPFPCTCVKEMWLLCQLALQKWSLKEEGSDEVKLTFWSLFNRAMEKIKNKLDIYSLTLLSYCEFSNWMMNALVRLYGYRSNGHYEGPNYAKVSASEYFDNQEFSERITQDFLNANPNEEQLRVFINLLTPILLQWWQPKVNTPMILWEYFHKKLNSSFYIVGAPPCNLAVACGSGRAYVDKYRGLLSKPPDANLSSFTLFTLLLGKCLEHLLSTQANHQAQKLLGRIYIKFSPQKFLALSEMGIHHLIELFLVLSLCGDFNDLSGKLKEKLLTISLEKVVKPKQVAVTKGHMALWILYAEHQLDLTDYVTKLLQQLTAIRNDIGVIKVIADTLLDIFEHADNFQRGEHLLVGPLIPNFLNSCTPVEQERTLEALHLIFVKIQSSLLFMDSNNEIIKALNFSILPFVKQHYVNSYSVWLPILAADFCTHSFAVTNTQSFQKLFAHFTEQQTANRQAVPQFLLKVLDSDRRTLVDHTTIMQIWLKSLVVLTAGNEDVVKLTKIVVNLPEFATMTNTDPAEVLQAKDPLCIFIAAVGKTYNAQSDNAKRIQIANYFNSYVCNFEKWLSVDLKLEKLELIFRFYSFLAVVIYNCPHIVYVKSKITCFFHIAITRYILPLSIQMGKAPERKLAQLVHKIWPVLLQGIGCLNFKTDPYLNKTLTDLIHKWTPHFKISPNAKQVARPYISCLQDDNHELSLFVIEKLTTLFLSTQRRQAHQNACLVITIFQEIVDAISSNAEDDDEKSIQHLLTFMKGCSLSTLEHIMMVDEIVPSRALLLDLFNRILHSPIYKKSPVVADLLGEHLRLLTKKHLSFNTFYFFELLMKLSRISYELIENIMPFLMEEIRVVEEKRGAGEDNRIRGCLTKLKQNIALARQKK